MAQDPLKPEPHPMAAGVHKGDEVYYKHPRVGPVSGTVVCHGAHGVQLKVQGDKLHRVKWDNVLGHKKRAQQAYKVVEQGEDGLVVAGKAGQRRFISTVPDQTPERVVLKR